MEKYIEIMKKHPNTKPTKYENKSIVYKVYEMSDGRTMIYASTNGSILRAIKNTICGYLNNEKNNKLGRFNYPFDVEVELIGCVYDKNCQQRVIDEYSKIYMPWYTHVSDSKLQSNGITISQKMNCKKIKNNFIYVIYLPIFAKK